MGDRINDGGPAFPCGSVSVGDGDTIPFVYGMTLRDWFAGQALAGICANSHTPWAPDAAGVDDAEVAKAAYDLADAMLAAREAK